jgi:hypothetical protein
MLVNPKFERSTLHGESKQENAAARQGTRRRVRRFLAYINQNEQL